MKAYPKRDRLLELAEISFAAGGVRSVTIADICEQSGMSKKTFYSIFRHKNELVSEVVSRVLQRTMAKLRLETAKVSGPSDALIQLWRNMTAIAAMKGLFSEASLRYYPEAQKTFETFKKEMLGIFQDNFEKGVSRGLYRSGPDSRTVAMLQWHYLEVIFKPGHYFNEEGMRTALEVLFNGILVSPTPTEIC